MAQIPKGRLVKVPCCKPIFRDCAIYLFNCCSTNCGRCGLKQGQHVILLSRCTGHADSMASPFELQWGWGGCEGVRCWALLHCFFLFARLLARVVPPVESLFLFCFVVLWWWFVLFCFFVYLFVWWFFLLRPFPYCITCKLSWSWMPRKFEITLNAAAREQCFYPMGMKPEKLFALKPRCSRSFLPRRRVSPIDVVLSGAAREPKEAPGQTELQTYWRFVGLSTSEFGAYHTNHSFAKFQQCQAIFGRLWPSCQEFKSFKRYHFCVRLETSFWGHGFSP